MSGVATETTYKLSIIVEGQDKASGPLGGVSGALGNVGEIAAGILASDVFIKLANGIKQMGTAAIQSAANYQTMQVGIEALMAREIARGKTTEQMVAQSASLTNSEQLKVITLGRTYEALGQQIEKLQSQYQNTAALQGAGSEAALNLSVQLDKLNGDYKTMGITLDDLKDKQDGTVFAMKAITTGTMSISDAMPQARVEAEKLLAQIRLLAIQSPFQLEDIQNTFKMAMAYGYASDEALAFTRGVLDMAAGVGASSDQLDRISYNLAQIRMVGKVTALDVRQLAMAGLDLNGVLKDVAAQSGYTIDSYQEFNALIDQGKLKWENFATSFEKYADTQFGGASKRLSQTWNGLMSNFKDVFSLTMPQILGPALEKVTGFLNKIMQGFIDFTNSGKLEEAGTKIADFVQGVLNGIGKISDFIDGIEAKFGNFSELMAKWDTGQGFVFAVKEAFGISLPPEFATVFDTAKGIVDNFVSDVKTSLGDFGNGNIDSFAALEYRIKIFSHSFGSGEGIGEAMKRAFSITLPPEVVTMFDTVVGYVNRVKDALEKAKPTFDKAFENFGKFWDEHGAGITESLQNISDTIQGIRIEVFQKIYDILGDLWEKVIPFVAKEFEKISAWFVDNGPLIQNFMEYLGKVFQTTADIIHVALVIIGGVVELVWSIVQPILSGVINIILDIAQLLMALATGDWPAAWDAMKQIVIDFQNALFESFVSSWDTLLGWFGTSFLDLKNKFVVWWDAIRLKVVEAWENIKSAIKEKTNAILTDIKTWIEDMIQKIKDRIEDFKQAGKDLIQGMWDGISERIEQMIAWLREKLQEIIDLTRRIFNSHSPSKVFWEIGYSIPSGLQGGINAGADEAVDAVRDMANRSIQVYQGVGNSNSNSYKNTITLQIFSDDPNTSGESVIKALYANGVELN